MENHEMMVQCKDCGNVEVIDELGNTEVDCVECGSHNAYECSECGAVFDLVLEEEELLYELEGLES